MVGHAALKGLGRETVALLALTQRRLCGPSFRDVEGEAARVHKAPVAKLNIGADENVLDRTVLGFQPGRILLKAFAAAQPRKNVGNSLLVGMELGDVVADVFLGSVAQQLELSAVGPQNGAV